MRVADDDRLIGTEDALAWGYERLYAGRPEGARRFLEFAAVRDPASAEVWGALGDTDESTGNRAAAAVRFARAASLEARRHWREAAAENLLAVDPVLALPAFVELRRERPDSARVERGLARALAASGRPAEAAVEWREVLSLDPDDVSSLVEAAEVMIRADAAVEALEVLARGARLLDDDPRFPALAARAWTALSEPGKAEAELARARALDPDHPATRAAEGVVAAARGGRGITPAYVRALFDGYAERFDHDLVDKLGYAAPALLRAAVTRARGAGAKFGRGIDLGCGTGLAGVAFRDIVGEMVGVDLSPRMVEAARRRGVYDGTEVGDAIVSLGDGRRWDLILAADVLVYIGDPAPLMTASARALNPGGLFALTAERTDDDAGLPFVLGPARRYAHAPLAVKGAALKAGFASIQIEDVSPRREGGRPVAGSLYILER